MTVATMTSGTSPDAPAFAIPDRLRGTEPGAPLSVDRLNRRLVHDLRAPLRALRILPDWIREDAAAEGVALPAVVHGHLLMIERQAARMDGFLTGLQELARLGEPERDQTRVDLSDALAKAAAEVTLPDAFGLHLAARPQEGVKGRSMIVRAAPADIGALLRHLIDNALRHHDRAQGHVWVRLRQAGSTGLIEVADDGPGIAAADQTRVFEPFTTLRPRDEVEGAGLGLAIAARITALLSGRIEIISQGRGTLVRVRLPLDAPDA